MSAVPPARPPKGMPAHRKLSAEALRKLAQTHTEVALQVLAEVAIHGRSEASRIAAAMALLDRGYGKSGTGLALKGGGVPPVLYHRIELIDGTEDKVAPAHPAAGDTD